VSAVHRIAIAGGPSFDCAPSENLVSAAERAGWALPASCRAGICGSCEGAVCDGAYVVPGRQDDGPLMAGPAQGVKLCRVRPRSDMTVAPREVHPVDAASLKPIAAKVLRIDKPAPDVAVLKLRFPAGVRARFRAGQYLRVVLDDGEERCFSMANPPQSNDGVELHVRHLPGGRFSDAVFNGMAPGDIVQIRVPHGDFWLRDSDKPVVFVAGGTGFAPVQSMVDDMLRRKITRPVRIYFGARTPELLYRDALARQWSAKHPGLEYVPVVSSPDDAWSGRAGLVHEAVLADLPSLAGHAVYACGAPPMVAAAREAFMGRGLAPSDFFCDAFAPSQSLALAPEAR
jgi:CDP-4-dehydro-6-deoxyglucose reductase/3-phenylpropionate/trans-cinnamate dioxygenase ferredoxin reductase subunit